jgi:putative inorganic carbon (HCO3(-)) transporter
LQGAAALERRSVRATFLVAGATAIVVVAVVAGSGTVGDRTAILLPVGLATGLGMTALALVRYEVFLAILIVVRASLDVVKVSSSSVDATGAVSVLFIGATFLWLLRSDDALHAPPSVRRVVVPLVALLAAGALSLTRSAHPLLSGVELVRMGTLVVIVVALGRAVRTPDDVRRFLVAIFGSAIVPLAVAGMELMRGAGGLTPGGVSRINGTFLHPNPFGAYLMLVIVLAVSLSPHVATRWRWCLGALVVTAACVLVTTYARGAWIATVVALVVVGVLQSRRVLWLMGAAMVAIPLMFPAVIVRLSDLSTERAPSGAPGNSLAWRFEHWREAISRQDDPMIGIGLKEVELSDEASAAPHNDYVRLFVETGIVGLAAYLWFFATLLREGVRALRRAPPGIARGLAVAFLAALTGIVVLSMAANVISQLVILWYFVAIVVLTLVAAGSDRERAVAATA